MILASGLVSLAILLGGFQGITGPTPTPAVDGSINSEIKCDRATDKGCRDEAASIEVEIIVGGSGEAVTVAVSDPVGRTREFRRAPFCEGMRNMPDAAFADPAPPTCSAAYPEIPLTVCEPGQVPLQALWRRDPAGDTAWGLWTPVSTSACVNDTTTQAAIALFQSMPITPITVTWQPNVTTIFTQMPVIVYVDPVEQQLTTTLGTQPIVLKAVPTTYTWDWGDGESTTTADPGKPWPDHTVFHYYKRTSDDYDITITPTTTWNGYYSLNNGVTWILIPGTATTQSPTFTLTAHTLHARLVSCDLEGNCYD